MVRVPNNLIYIVV